MYVHDGLKFSTALFYSFIKNKSRNCNAMVYIILFIEGFLLLSPEPCTD
jgi:hypothetical protein